MMGISLLPFIYYLPRKQQQKKSEQMPKRTRIYSRSASFRVLFFIFTKCLHCQKARRRRGRQWFWTEEKLRGGAGLQKSVEEIETLNSGKNRWAVRIQQHCFENKTKNIEITECGGEWSKEKKMFSKLRKKSVEKKMFLTFRWIASWRQVQDYVECNIYRYALDRERRERERLSPESDKDPSGPVNEPIIHARIERKREKEVDWSAAETTRKGSSQSNCVSFVVFAGEIYPPFSSSI